MNIIAPAKLNLFFHITGRRADHYHLIESFFVFTEFGDGITLAPAEKITLKIDGPFSPALQKTPTENNLMMRAANVLQKISGVDTGAAITLTKNIPIAAGLGGGSSDAAATLKALNKFWNMNLNEKKLSEIGLTLGADIPACLYQRAAFVSGIGEIIEPITLPTTDLFIVLVNPNKPLSTQKVFQYHDNSNASFHASVKNSIASAGENKKLFFDFLSQQQNDLEFPAIQLMPDIRAILSVLKNQSGCVLSRMSGSGPTCFAIFENHDAALRATKNIQHHHTKWWSELTPLK